MRLSLLGVLAPTLDLTVSADQAAQARQAGQLLIADAEGAPVAELHLDLDDTATADTTTADTAARGIVRGDVRDPATTTTTPRAESPSGPYASLRLRPHEGRLDGAAAIVGHDPVDHVALAAATAVPGTPVLFVVLDGPRAVPGPDSADVTMSALSLRDDLRSAGATAQVIVVPAPQYGDERDDDLAVRIAAAYGATRVAGARSPDRAALDDALDHDTAPPEHDWPSASLRAWRRWRPPRRSRGLVLFFTGLSGSGKSTIARAVADHLAETASRTVTLLDGDVVRRNLSAGLGFSPTDRDRNIERIGFVAAEIARHGGLAICAPIAPFAATRSRVRAMAEATGDFVLVHVATPLEECERRDRKGLYARARAGEIADFTGISSPYEAPADADLSLDTSTMSISDARDQVLELLAAGGWIARPAR